MEMKWSDEKVWKFFRHLKLDEDPDQALQKEREDWETTKTIMKPGTECEFRVR